MSEGGSVKVSMDPEKNPILAESEEPEDKNRAKFLNEDGTENFDRLYQSYSDLQRKMSGGDQAIEIPDEAADTPDEPEADAPEEPAEDAETPEVELPEGEAPAVPMRDDGLPGTDEQRAAWSEQWVAEGKLTDDQYTELEGAFDGKVSREMIDNYFGGLAAQQENRQRTAVEILGGAEKVAAIQDWSREGLSPRQRKAFNEAMRSGDPVRQEEALEGVRLRYEAAVGTVGRQVRGGGGGGEVKPFTSREEKLAAMSDPKYRESAAYRSQVKARARAGGF